MSSLSSRKTMSYKSCTEWKSGNRGEDKMGDTIHDGLKKLVAELGQDAGLNQPSLLRKRIAERFDPLVAGVLDRTVTAEVPNRLREMAAVTLTRTAVVNYAKQIAVKTGLIEDVARWTIEAWADALGLAIAGNKPPPIAGSLQQLLAQLQNQRIQLEPPTVAVATRTTAGAKVALERIAGIAIVLTPVIVIIYFVIVYFNKPRADPSPLRLDPSYYQSSPLAPQFDPLPGRPDPGLREKLSK
jgi:hypothetical protein